MRVLFITSISLALCACGIKPAQLQPPPPAEGQERIETQFPKRYPPLQTPATTQEPEL